MSARPKVLFAADSNPIALEDVTVKTETANNLTMISVTEETIKDPESNRVSKVDPYPNKTPKEMLTREFLILSSAMSQGTVVRFFPASLLYANTTIQNYIKLFRFVRASVSIRIVAVSNAMQYGAILVSKLPYIGSTDLTSYASVEQQTQSDAFLLDITEQTSLELELPYMKPNLFDRVKGSSLPAFYDWRVTMNMLKLGTVSLGAPTQVAVKVFAHFTDIEVSGYLDQTHATFQMEDNSAGATLRNTMRNFADAYRIGSALYHTVVKDFTSAFDFQKAPEMDGVEEDNDSSMKLDVGSNLSAPNRNVKLNGAILGDARRSRHTALPSLQNWYELADICKIPTYVGMYDLARTTDHFEVSGLLSNLPKCHFQYIRRCFRLYRGGVNFYFRILCSPFISTRIKFTLHPSLIGSETPTLTNDTIGDLPSWILSIKGPTEWSIGIPYFQPTPWTIPGTEAIKPQLSVALLDDLVQPYDKSVSITVLVFAAAADDLQLSGLQSPIPPKTAFETKEEEESDEEAIFQCSLTGKLGSVRLLGSTDPHQYMGGVGSVVDVLSRYSTRETNQAFPFPSTLQAWSEAYAGDTFEWFCSLYAFYTGPLNVKAMFSKAPANGLIEMIISSSQNPVSAGHTFKSGNSYTMTHQAIWPMLEFQFPYINIVEFDSVRIPYSSPFGETYTNEAEISKSLIAAPKEFRLFYLMPIPDFFFTPEVVADEEEAQFQMYPRYPYTRNFGGFLSLNIDSTTSSVSQLILTDSTLSGTTFHMDLSLVFYTYNSDDQGPDGCFATVAGNNTPLNPTGAASEVTSTYLITCCAAYGDNTAYASGSFASPGFGSNFYLNISWPPRTAGYPALTYHLFWTLRIAPWKFSNFLSCPQVTSDTLGKVSADVTSSTTMDVAVVNEPTVMLDSSATVHLASGTTVAVSTLPDVVIGSPLPLPVSVTGTADVNARVQGVVTPDTPVWVTNYF